MYCCDQCFQDIELRGVVYSQQPVTIGTCDYCHAENATLCESTELAELFMQLVPLFTPAPGTPGARLLGEELQHRWQLFNIDDVAARTTLLQAILANDLPADDPVFTQPVVLAPIVGEDAGAMQEVLWEEFASEIKYGNRFFLQHPIELSLLDNLLPVLEKEYPVDTIFYRGRVGQQAGFQIGQMGKPPAKLASAGRANPQGIPYLYVAKSLATTVYESRCTYLDFLSVGEFRVAEPIRVISLQGIARISPFRWGSRLEYYLVYEKYLAKLESELSRPLRRFDNELDYLPSEYLCEYFKSRGYDGIEYGSALHAGGVNLAIFNDFKLQGGGVSVHEVISVDLQTQPVV